MSRTTLLYLSVIVLLIGICAIQTVKISHLDSTIASLSAENHLLDQTLKDEQNKFKQTVQTLQDQLSQYALDEQAYQCAVSCKAEAIDKKAKEEGERIAKELESNSSSDNQLDIARRVLNDFNRNKKD